MVSEAMTKWMGGFLVFALGCGSAFGEGESPKVLPLPPLVIETPWLQERQEKQLATVEQFQVFHDFRFTDEVVASGITFRHKVVDDAGRNYKAVHYDHGNGLAVADVDGDGHLDIYFATQVGSNELWRSRGDGTFENITARAGVGMADRISVAVSFADIDNDGDPDLFVTSVREGNQLFENLGSGKFKNISAASGLDHRGHSSGAVFFDYDRDGLLDLLVTNVGQYTSEKKLMVVGDAKRGIEADRYEYYEGFGDAFSGHLKPERSERSILYRNMGKNRFKDVSEKMGLMDESWSGDASPMDGNGDGWPDLYLLNMQGHDQYYENEQGKRFVNKSREVFPRTPWGSMGIKVFDYNNDGVMDLYITDMHSDMSTPIALKNEKLKSDMRWKEDYLQSGGMSIYGNAFFEGQGDGTFREISDANGTENLWPWGLGVGDLNADGFVDVFVASSMNFPFRYCVNTVLLNNQGKKFLDSEFILGIEPRRDGLTAARWFESDCTGEEKSSRACQQLAGKSQKIEVWGALGSRSSVIFDLDGDGDLDIVTNEFNGVPMVLVSNLSEQQKDLHYLKIKLTGTKSNRSGLGAVVKVKTATATYTKVHDGKSGYLSQSLYPLYFGLGAESKVEYIEITWPSGKRQRIDAPLVSGLLLEIKES